ncbi:hypothetical protein D3C87_1147590 [compost metagenome]
MDCGEQGDLTVELGKKRTCVVRRIEDLRAFMSGTRTDQVQAQSADCGSASCLDQRQWTHDGVGAMHRRPGNVIGHVQNLLDQVERRRGQSLL